jgi:hypothetical protein
MKKEDLKKLVDSPEMISGIYNYCDRWCERCSFTNRCATFAFEQEQFPDPEKDMENEVFWDKLSEVFELTMEMILEDAEDLGIDLDDIDFEESAASREKVEEVIENHYCSKLSENYSSEITKWFAYTKDLLTDKVESIAHNSHIGIDGNQAEELSNTIEIINWYKYQIHVKISRGLHSTLDGLEEDEEFPKDSDGSVKVALIGIDRSIAAWGKMLQIFPEQEDEILEILVILERLRRSTEKEFPQARDFKRIGFDD